MEVMGIIMASGSSKRLGRNKLLLDIDNTNKTIIEKTIETIIKSKIKNILAVYEDEKVFSKIEKYKITKLKNEKSQLGQSESIKLGIVNILEKEVGYMFFVGDQYFLNEKTIDKMIDLFNENENYIIMPKGTNETGNPIIFPYKFRERLLNLEGDKGGRKIIDYKKDNIKYVEVLDRELIDIDTKEDLLRVKKELKR